MVTVYKNYIIETSYVGKALCGGVGYSSELYDIKGNHICGQDYAFEKFEESLEDIKKGIDSLDKEKGK